MRIVDEIMHPEYKITVFGHNNKFSLQIESDMLTQTYKFRESEALRIGNEFRKLLDENFFAKVEEQFRAMRKIQTEIQINFNTENDIEFPSVI